MHRTLINKTNETFYPKQSIEIKGSVQHDNFGHTFLLAGLSSCLITDCRVSQSSLWLSFAKEHLSKSTCAGSLKSLSWAVVLFSQGSLKGMVTVVVFIWGNKTMPHIIQCFASTCTHTRVGILWRCGKEVDSLVVLSQRRMMWGWIGWTQHLGCPVTHTLALCLGRCWKGRLPDPFQ